MSYKVEATVDGIKFLYDGGEVEVDYNVSDGDVVRLTIEPLEVKVTDGFRAAVKKACNCDSSSGGGSGGSTGGGVLVVHETVTEDDEQVMHTLDKTYQEIEDAGFCVKHKEESYGPMDVSTLIAFGYNELIGCAVIFSDATSILFSAESKSDFPTYKETK